MTFFDSLAGQNFCQYTVPELIDSIQNLTEELHRANEFREKDQPGKDDSRAFEVTELCPHCEKEISLIWNTDRDGFKAYCPHCGNTLMLCDECLHQEAGRTGNCDYSSKTDSCQHNQNGGRNAAKQKF